ncbi:histidine kinase [Aliikangiella sp. IMCC44359]|uniref:histidine kinase n=1 Tax=Aliikangiella sp. IMCC44359 TaxID=3459125 RepID=UPI00403AC19C
MSLKLSISLVFLFLILSFNVQGENEVEYQPIIGKNYFMTKVDNPEFVNPVSDYSRWTKISFGGIPLKDKNFWVQVNFEISKISKKPQGIFVSMLGAYQAYWDGQYIGSNGVVGKSKNTEKPGQIDYVMLLPQDYLTIGTHTLSLKVSTHHAQNYLSNGSFFSFIGDYQSLVQAPFRHATLPITMSGALLLIAFYYLLLYFSVLREPSYLWFSGLCLTIFLLFVVESWRGLWGYSYDWQVPRLYLVLILSCLVSCLLSLFFMFFFQLTKRLKIFLISLNLILQIAILLEGDGFDDRSLYIFLIGTSTSIIVCVYAVVNNQKDAWLMLLGLILFIAPIAIHTYSYMDQYFFVSFGALISLMLYLLTRTMQLRQKQLVQSQIAAGRLELELVKRNIQPHFILNTLTAVEEWIEDSPKTAVKFILALADEFRMVAQMSSQRLISLQDEVSLCCAHLDVMGFRSNTHFKLNSEVADLMVQIPPGVILTLIENAISHNNYQQQTVTFTLEQIHESDNNVLVFSSPVNNNLSTNMINSGLGSQYIEARLQESFISDWDVKSKFEHQCWQVTLTFPWVYAS